MKKILALVLAVVMIMAMSIPAFAANEDEIAPCATCNGNHTYSEASSKTTYSYSSSGCMKVVTTYYKCNFCPASYSTTSNPVSELHVYRLSSATCNGTTQTHYKTCSNCKHVKMVNGGACPGAVHTGDCRWLPI